MFECTQREAAVSQSWESWETAVSKSSAGAAPSCLCLGRSSFQKAEDILGKREDSRVAQNM